ncbi:MAG: flagellar biosynthetic protein FliR [Rhodospirillales bacterium]|nr:flagellar biosynthetic protein FliR [Rhodospirillales bacterium]
MTAADAAFVQALPALAFQAMLVLARIGGAVMLLPGLGEAALPPMVRAAIAVSLTALLLPVLLPALPAAPAGVWQSFAMLAAELASGIWLGWLARLVVLSLAMGGEMIAAMFGLSNVLWPDPALGPTTPALGQLFGLAATAFVLASGLYVLPLTALVESYRVIPAGGLLPAGDGAHVVVAAVGASFALALRIAAPFLLASLIWQFALGLASRLVPQVPIYFVSLPGQIVGGFALLAGLAATLVSLWLGGVREGFGMLPGMR